MHRLSIQLCILSLGLLQNGDVGVSVLPEREEIIIGGAGFGSVALQSVGPRKAQMRERASDEILYDVPAIEATRSTNWNASGMWNYASCQDLYNQSLTWWRRGVGTFTGVENTQVIDFARRSKLTKLTKCAQLERIWNTAFSSLLALFLWVRSTHREPPPIRGWLEHRRTEIQCLRLRPSLALVVRVRRDRRHFLQTENIGLRTALVAVNMDFIRPTRLRGDWPASAGLIAPGR
jgi:hypothetical protein